MENPDSAENTQQPEVAPPVESAQTEQVAGTETPAESPVTPTDKEELLLGKFKSADDLAKAYKELETQQGTWGQRLNDPNFIYERAKQLGLAEEEEAIANGLSSTPQVNQPDITTIINSQVESRLDYEKAVADFPEIKSNPALSTWGAGLVDQGYTYSQAVQIIKDNLGKVTESASTTARQEARQEITDKERAQTATQTAPVNSDQADSEDLQERMKSLNKKTQEEAMVEWLLKKNKK